MRPHRVAAIAFAAICFTSAAHASCPTITPGPAVLPDATLNQGYSQLLTVTGGTPPYTFSIPPTSSPPPGLKVFGDKLLGTPTQAGTFTFKIQATDANSCFGTSTFTLKVRDPNAGVCPTITIAPTSLPSGVVGMLYSAKVIASGGASPYTYNLGTGSPPAGIGLSMNTITGFPTRAGSYSFQLVATDSNRCSGTQDYVLEVVDAGCPQDVAILLTPASDASLDSSKPVTFSWTSVAGANGYAVLVSSDNGATFAPVATVPANTTTATATLSPGTYLAVIRTLFGSGCSTRSTATRFSVTLALACGGGTVALTSPTNGATMSSPVTFSWSAVTGASAYRVWFGIDNGAPTIISRVTGTSTTVQVPSGAAEWYVEAIFDNCPSIVSEHRKFTVLSGANCGANQTPTLISPLSGDVASPATLSWTAVNNAIAYRVWIAPAGLAFSELAFTTSTTIQRALLPTSYTWYVDAIFGGCPPVSSTKASFNVPDTAPRCNNDTPAIVAPANGASVPSPVVFSWSAVANAIEYRVFASIDGGEVKLIGETANTTLTANIPLGNVLWFVEAAFKGCPAMHSASSRFTIPRAASCPTTKPALLSPANGASDVTTPITFSWSAVSGAVRYILVVRGANGAPVPIGETNLTQLQRSFSPGTIQWSVIALGAGCDPITSDTATFTIPSPEGCGTKRPHVLAPSDDAVGVASPVHFAWTKVPAVKIYKLRVQTEDGDASVIATTTDNEITVPLGAGRIRWSVEAAFDSCPSLFSGPSDVTIAPKPSTCTTPSRPAAHVVAQVLSATDFTVRWTGVANAGVYELQESTTADFSNATTSTVAGVNATFNHVATTTSVQYFYRVRAVSSCSDDRGPFSRIVSTRVIPPNTAATRTRGTAEIGVQNIVLQTLTLPGSATPVAFTATTDKPWLTVSPSSGTIPTTGLTLTVMADPKAVNVGTTHGTVHVAYASTGGSGRIETNANTPPTNIPISISLVTPVVPDTKATPPPESLIIPAVAHGPGANNSLFQSDIRLANTSSQAMTYLINFTPTATDGTQTGTTTTIQVDPGATTALDDILSSFFGTASDGSATGMLEIRPLTSSSSSSIFSSVPSSALASVASSRTYNVTSQGTFGQFIPAIPFSQFVGQGSILSLQQIAQSSAYRTNFGLVEAAGEPANVMLHVFDKAGNLIADIPENLLPSEHLQINGLLNNISLDDGRIEVEVLSTTGKVSAYASVVANDSNDPFLVSPVLKSAVNSNRYVIPGVAYSNGIANWRTDVRLYNSASISVNATLTYYPQGAPGSPRSQTITIAAGETRGIDNILNTMFGITDPSAGGSVVVTTTSTSSIIASARTYTPTDIGTVGQFIPAVTPVESVGVADRALQLLQLEYSDAFRTNIGLAETTGNLATVEVSLVLPDSKVTPIISFSLAPNEFIQFSLASFGLTDSIYNARVAVKVVDGTGKATAYGSLVDNLSKDPTYVPAQ
ncbi:MAG TPA: Ig domain-containing protein [Thermoanaerobaculia bacterium]|nr:Ig domain-containing protein [Thermoanaerobaculia bacterium]